MTEGIGEVKDSLELGSRELHERIQTLVQSLQERMSEAAPTEAAINEQAVVARLRGYTAQVCAMLERTQDTLVLSHLR